MLPKRDPRIDPRPRDVLSPDVNPSKSTCLYRIRSVNNDIVRYYLVYPDIKWPQVVSLLDWRDIANGLTVVTKAEDLEI